MKRFDNKTVVVTGASSGIGEALAREFAARGANVVLGARSADKLERITAEIRATGAQAVCRVVDVVKQIGRAHV